MPRVKMTAEEAKAARLSEMILGRMAYMGLTAKDVGEIIGRCEKTAAELVRDPSKMTVGQWFRLAQSMHFSTVIEPQY